MRRALAGVLLAASAGAVPPADAAPCFLWTDPAADATDPDLDLVGANVAATATDLVATFGVADLGASARLATVERFALTFGVHDHLVQLVATRDRVSGTTGSSFVVDGAVTSAGTAVFDAAADTVTLSVPRAAIEEKAGPLAGATLGWLRAETISQLHTVTERADLAAAPARYGYAVGDACTGAAAPVPAAPAPEPLRPQKEGCATLTDPAGDGRVSTSAPNDPDLDLLSLTLWATDDELRAFVRVAGLGTRPAAAPGHTFTVEFTTPNKKPVAITATGYDPASLRDVRDTGSRSSSGRVATSVLLRVGGVVQDTAPVTATFDRAANTVYFAVRRGDVEYGAGSALADGAVVTGVAAHTSSDYGTLLVTAGDTTAPLMPDEAAKVTWEVGENACFPPLPAKLTVPDAAAQYGDRATLATTLTDSAGKPLAGRPVDVTVAGRKLRGTTDAAGAATVTLPSDLPAGNHAATVTFAGDRKAGPVSRTATYRVSVEATRWATQVTKASAKTRTVTATLTEDDPRALGGQPVTWYVNGKLAANARTDSAGRVVLKGVATGRTVTVRYAGSAGRYRAADATART